ncbi:MAG: T9SS type A sorting domain-containing protein [Calditrichaeota bacterium]|nr:T9SS type A sorting domain-containing protein [Calditrichota bacterium]
MNRLMIKAQAAFAACALIAFLPGLGLSQPDTVWTTSFPTNTSNGIDIFRIEDGEFVVASGAPSRRAFQICRIDSEGALIEVRTYDPANRVVAQYPYSSCRMPDGGYFMGGLGSVRVDSRLDSIWSKSRYEGGFGGYGSIPAHDGDIIVTGGRFAFKVGDENEGEIIWRREYENVGGSLNSGLWDCLATDDGGYLFAGITARIGNGGDDFYAVKVDVNGEIEWENTNGTQLEDLCLSVASASGGGWCLAGTHRYGEAASHRYAMLVRIDSDGEVIWSRIYDEVENGDFIYDVEETPDGGFVSVGKNSRSEYLIQMRVDCNGEYLWGRRYGLYQEGNRRDWARGDLTSVILMDDGGYVVCGTADGGPYQGGFLARTEPDPVDFPQLIAVSDTLLDFGEVLVGDSVLLPLRLSNPGRRWTEVDSITASDPAFSVQYALPVLFFPWDTLDIPILFHPDTNREYSALLTIHADTTSLDVTLSGRGVPLAVPDDGGIGIPPYEMELSVSPNPFNANTLIRYELPWQTAVNLTIYDIAGAEAATLVSGTFDPGRHSVVWDGSSHPAGIYFIHFEAAGRSRVVKAVLIK